MTPRYCPRCGTVVRMTATWSTDDTGTPEYRLSCSGCGLTTRSAYYIQENAVKAWEIECEKGAE